MKRIVLAALLAFSCQAMAGKWIPMYTGTVTFNETKELSVIKSSIVKSLTGRGWTIEERNDDHYLAVLKLRSHVVHIRVAFEAEEVTIHYVSSNNLEKTKRGKKKVHRNYKNWVVNLERDIAAFASR